MFRLFLQQEFQQFRSDVDLIVEEKNELGESFLNHQIESGRQSPGSFTISEESSPASPSHKVLLLIAYLTALPSHQLSSDTSS